MRAHALAFVVLLLTPAAAARSFEVNGVDDGASFFFTWGGVEGMDPTIAVQPNETLEIAWMNAGSVPHNLHFGPPISRETPGPNTPGTKHALTVKVPAEAPDGTIAYWCVFHRNRGMEGALRLSSHAGAALDVLAPRPRQELDDGNVSLSVAVQNFQLVPPGTGAGPGRGHLHVAVDGNATLDTASSNVTIPSVPPGHHLLRVELVDDAHRPLDPPVFREVAFFVALPARPTLPPATPSPTEESDDVPLPWTALLLAALVAAALTRMRRR